MSLAVGESWERQMPREGREWRRKRQRLRGRIDCLIEDGSRYGPESVSQCFPRGKGLFRLLDLGKKNYKGYTVCHSNEGNNKSDISERRYTTDYENLLLVWFPLNEIR